MPPGQGGLNNRVYAVASTAGLLRASSFGAICRSYTVTGPTSIITLPAPSPPFAYFSPTLARLPEASRPAPLPACASCPASGWFTTTGGLSCFCTSYSRMVWRRSAEPVTACDGREKALARLEAELAGA